MNIELEKYTHKKLSKSDITDILNMFRSKYIEWSNTFPEEYSYVHKADYNIENNSIVLLMDEIFYNDVISEYEFIKYSKRIIYLDDLYKYLTIHGYKINIINKDIYDNFVNKTIDKIKDEYITEK